MFEWFQMVRNVGDITRLATMSDTAFTKNTDKLRSHPSIEFRALCATRWAHITYPGEDRSSRAVEAYHLWGQPQDYMKFETFEATFSA